MNASNSVFWISPSIFVSASVHCSGGGGCEHAVQGPPQSMPVSPWFWIPSEQLPQAELPWEYGSVILWGVHTHPKFSLYVSHIVSENAFQVLHPGSACNVTLMYLSM